MRLGCLGALVLGATPALAQDRSSYNAITQADDAFGFSIGRESVGIYTSGNARGFSPTAAGNVRIDGLYFDPLVTPTSAISNSTSIKVGLSAQGYPFTAPSGVVDYALVRPASQATSAIANADSYGGYGLELDGSVPISAALAVGYGASGVHTEFFDGTSNFLRSESIIGRWRPRAGIEIIPFWMAVDDYHDEVSPSYVPSGEFIPRLPRQRSFVGPDWAAYRSTGVNEGMVANASLGENWVVRLGAFRSVIDYKRGFESLLANETPNGTGEHLIIADPRRLNQSLSGELRLAHVIPDGPRLHTLQLSIRERGAHRQFGGSEKIDFGQGSVEAPFHPAEPALSFGSLSRDHVQQATFGVAYDGRWKNVGELSFSLARAFYRKTTALADQPIVRATSSPWLYDATIAANVARGLVVYAGYARGLEESGLAPANASNRNEPLPAIITQQKDAGFRLNITAKLRLVAGVFDLTRPYFGFDQTSRYLQVGTSDNRGAEVSLSGAITPRLNILLGGVFLDAKVAARADTGDVIGRRPVGIPGHILNASANWRAPFAKGVELDLALYQRGTVPGTTDNLVILPRWTRVDLGARYHFRLVKQPTTFRLHLVNVFDTAGPMSEGPGIYRFNPGRVLTGTMTVDL